MILTGKGILDAVKRGDITISPFDAKRLTTNSYDFRLADELLVYTEPELDVARANDTKCIRVDGSGHVLLAGELYLGSTLERMGSVKYVPIIKGRSSIARLGLFIHATADLIDIGSINHWTLQLIPTMDVRIYPRMRIGQVTFWVPLGDVVPYDGKYGRSVGPMASMSYLDFNDS